MVQQSWNMSGVITPASPSGKDAREAGLEKASVLGHVYEGRPFLANNQPITGEFATQTQEGPVAVVELALENGNSGTRAMALHFVTHQAAITQTANTFEEEQTSLIYSTGEVGEFWQIENLDGSRSPIFRVGEHADGQQDLPIGPTYDRWSDLRFVNFNRAVLARTLRSAGYGQGVHYVCICPGARNEEVSVERGVDPRVQNAFIRGLQPFVIWRNRVERYDIRPIKIMPAIPQTFGSHYSYDSDVLGQSLNPDVPMWNWFDVGFFDGHDVTVRRVGKSVRVSGVKVTDGMSKIVRGLGAYLRQPDHFPMIAPPSYAQALEMMRSGEVKIAGMPLDSQEEMDRGRRLIQSYKDKEGGKLIRTMMANHPAIDSVFAFTGGGVIDLLAQIQAQTEQRPKNLVKIMHPEVARIANVVGIFWLLNLAHRRDSVLRTPPAHY